MSTFVFLRSWASFLAASFSVRRFLDGLVQVLIDGYFQHSGAIFEGRDALIKICILFFLFIAGLQMNLKLVRNSGIHIAWASLMDVLLPFTLGFCMVVMFPNMWGIF